MSKFGELIDRTTPLLLVFFEELEERYQEFHPTLTAVAAAVGDQGKVIKIDVNSHCSIHISIRFSVKHSIP